MVIEGRWVKDFSSFLVAEKNPTMHRLSVPLSAADGKLALPLYLFDGFRRPVVSRAFPDYGID